MIVGNLRTFGQNQFIKSVRKIFRPFLVAVLLVANFAPLTARAIDTTLEGYLANQNYNSLVSDADFLDVNAMSAADIQAFLVGKGSYLASAPASQLGTGANGRSAAQIIFEAAKGLYDAAVGCANGVCINSSTGTISPKAILITLQKEQSLITTSTYNENGLRKAMGYGCPDGGSCDSTYYGFSNQVGWGAWQLRYNTMAAENYVTPYYVGRVHSIGDSDGVRSVYFSNRATASLFRYTPHTYYGNYNFWRLGIEWFGWSGGGGGSVSTNDTSSASARMYANGTFLVKSIKESSVLVAFNGEIIVGTGPTSWEYQFTPAIGTHAYNFEYRSGTDYSLIGTKVITVEKRKNGDINGDSAVTLLDLSLVGTSYGQNVKDDDWTNLNPGVDSVINLLDISIFANSWEG